MYRMCFSKYKTTWDVLPRLLKHNYSDGRFQSCRCLCLHLLIWLFLSQVNWYFISFYFLFLSYFWDTISESTFLLHRLVTSWWTARVLWSPEDRSFFCHPIPFCTSFLPASSLQSPRNLRFLEGSWKAGLGFAKMLPSPALGMQLHTWERRFNAYKANLRLSCEDKCHTASETRRPVWCLMVSEKKG